MMEKAFVTLVYAEHVNKAWPQASALLKPAVDRIMTHDIEDVRKMILAGKAQLWVQYNSETKAIDAALVSEFENFPKGLFLNVWLYGVAKGKEALEAEFEQHMFNLADANQCVGIKHTGRKGWLQRHKHLPVYSESVVYVLLLSDIKKATGG